FRSLDGEPERFCGGGGGEYAVVGHVPDEGDRVDVLFTQPVGEPGPGEDAGVLLAEPPCRPGLVGGDAGMVGGGGGPGGKYRGVGGKLVLNDHHGDLGALGGLDRGPDRGAGFVTGGGLDREGAVGVVRWGVEGGTG